MPASIERPLEPAARLLPLLLVLCLAARADAETPRGPSEIVGPTILEDMTDLIDRVRPSTVFVLAMDEFGQVIQGTGLVIRSDGWIATAFDLVSWTRDIEVQVLVDGQLRAYGAHLVRTYPARNLALLHVAADGLTTLDDAATADFQPGAPLVGLGYPNYNQLERGLRITRGRLSIPLIVGGTPIEPVYTAELLYVSGLAGSAVCTPEGALMGMIIGAGPVVHETAELLPIAGIRARLEAVAASYIVPLEVPARRTGR